MISSRDEVSGFHLPRVLIADDDSATRLLLQRWLQDWGYQTVVAADGNEAWTVLQQAQPPEILLVDWVMPGLDGIALTRKLRSDAREYYHYILVITVRDKKADAVHALEAGADDLLVKPVDPPELKARLVVANRILQLQNRLIDSRDKVQIQAMHDPLTGLWNRNAFFDFLRGALDRKHHENEEIGLLLLDIDYFKIVNDTHGHQAGDLVLEEIARRLKAATRSSDFIGRFGGEEFCIALPGCGSKQLRKRAEDLRLAISDEPILIDECPIPVTVSIGGVIARGDFPTSSELIAAADTALYGAKNAGRNQTVCCIQPRLDRDVELPYHCEAHCNPGQEGVCILSRKQKGSICFISQIVSSRDERSAGVSELPGGHCRLDD